MSDNLTNPVSISLTMSETWLANIEQASLRAWPALEEQSVGNWRLRFSRGFTRRANSVSITNTKDDTNSEAELFDKIVACEQHYHDRKLPTIFRLVQPIEVGTDTRGTPTSTKMDQALANRNYRYRDASLVLVKELDTTARASTSIYYVDMQTWLTAYQHISISSDQAQHLHRLILQGIQTKLLFALTEQKHQNIACALGVLDGQLLGLFDIATHTDFRKQGFARALVQHLCAQGYSSGAKFAYLQVQEDNLAAIALYTRLGFSPAYRYGYRIEGEFEPFEKTPD